MSKDSAIGLILVGIGISTGAVFTDFTVKKLSKYADEKNRADAVVAEKFTAAVPILAAIQSDLRLISKHPDALAGEVSRLQSENAKLSRDQERLRQAYDRDISRCSETALKSLCAGEWEVLSDGRKRCKLAK